MSNAESPAALRDRLGTRNGNEPQEEQELMVFHIDPAMRELLQPIVERYEVAQAKVDEQQAILDGVKKEASVLLNMLKAAGVVERKKYAPQKPKAEKPAKKTGHITEERAAEALEKIRAFVASPAFIPALPDVPNSFTRKQLADGTNINLSSVGYAIERLREQGHVRQAGLVRTKGGQKADVFALA